MKRNLSHLNVFPEGQFVAVEPDGTVVGSASTLIVTPDSEYADPPMERDYGR